MPKPRLTVLCSPPWAPAWRQDLERLATLVIVDIASTRTAPLGGDILVDVDLADPVRVRRLRGLLVNRRPGRLSVLVEAGRRVQEVQADALDATLALPRPVAREDRAGVFSQLLDLPEAVIRERILEGALADCRSTNDRAAGALGSAFAAFGRGGSLSVEGLKDASRQVVNDIDDIGLDRWLSEVRSHHAGTYQHCLSVTGLIAAFAARLGMDEESRRHQAFAGLVHDVGKARISLQILDKPGALTPAEFAVMKGHTTKGHAYLKAHATIDADILEMVLNHHEYLDGSGYPNGLSGDRIDRQTRILTICDVFSALVERRAYKLPMAAPAAWDILAGMAQAGRLDRDLVDAFRDLALTIDTGARPIAASA